MMIGNENIDAQTRERLARVFPSDPFDSLANTFAKLSGGLKIEFFGIEVASAAKREHATRPPLPLIDRVEALEQIIRERVDDATYLVVFDELDEDYKDVMTPSTPHDYSALLTSLFKAVQDVKTVFPVGQCHILPVVFLRDDIYDVIRDPDKSKWSDLRIDLEWNNDQIRGLLAFRISRALPSVGARILGFRRAWYAVFVARVRGDLNKEFAFLTRRTCGRPRDYIRVLQFAAARAGTRHEELIDVQTLRNVGRDVSRSFRADMQDEIEGVLPEASGFLDVIAQLRSKLFTADQFSNTLSKEVERGRLPAVNAEHVLRVLFHFSAIGNQRSLGSERIFRYLNPDATFSLDEAICIHPGLLESMQIQETEREDA